MIKNEWSMIFQFVTLDTFFHFVFIDSQITTIYACNTNTYIFTIAIVMLVNAAIFHILEIRLLVTMSKVGHPI